MKTYFTLFCFFVMTLSWVRAEVTLPDLTIKEAGEKQSLELRELSIHVRMSGLLVETIFDLEFYNHSKRRQEGEFVLQLPQGATVSTYALEIKGHMWPGVAVEKGKARHAYESIKRRMVDPGLVEREAGNIYRTRIFPLEPMKTKRVRIGYIQTLPDDGKFVFPLVRKGMIKKFTCVVEGAVELPQLSVKVLSDTVKKTGDEKWLWQARNVKLDTELRAKSALPELNKAIVLIERQADGSGYFVVQGKAPVKNSDKLEKKWRKIRLIWDASYSRRWQKHDKEFAALRRLWQEQGACEVQVQVLNTQLGEGRVFQIAKGNGVGKKLEKYLQGLSYDGAADFSQIDEWDGITLLFTDGIVGSPIWHLDQDGVVESCYLITSGVDRVDPGFFRAKTKWINLASKNWWQELRQMATGIQVKGGRVRNLEVSRKGGFFTVSGGLVKGSGGTLTLRMPGGDDIEVSLTDQTSRAAAEWNFARRVWAQRHLLSLERELDAGRITTFAKAERLVSDHTSLIVLERFEDHVRYEIPPPEPELLELYHRSLESRGKSTKIRAINVWKAKNIWYETRFVWLDGELEEEIRAVGIWVKASRIAFPETKRNTKALDRFQKWLLKAEAVRGAKNNLKSAQGFKQWSERLDQRMKELDAFRAKPIEANAGQPLHVSVRGFVKERGVYSAKDPFSLIQAVAQAGGPNQYGSKQRVFLYRDAQRTGYNMASSRYIDVKLKWGDMIVVEDAPRSEHWGDPFADAGASDPFVDEEASGDPIFEQAGEKQARRDSPYASSSAAQILGDETTDNAGGNGDSGLGGVFVGTEVEVTMKGVDKSLLKVLSDHPKAAEAYADLLKGEFGRQSLSMAMVIEISRILFEKKEPVLASRVLSNLCELQSNSFEATRSYAYWLAELGNEKQAIHILKALLEVTPDAASKALLYFDLGQLTDKAGFFIKSLQEEINSNRNPQLASISLTDYFGRGGKVQGDLFQFKKNAMPSDVRIVITSIGGAVDATVEKPSRFGLFADHGGRLKRGDRVDEYMMRRALPGAYKVSLIRWENELEPITVRVDFYIRWASDKEQKRTRTVLMEGRKLDLGELVFDWGE
ncbi:MAG: VIT domain-containing protein [Verrucomicrobiota bacterium]